jgi:hypothetical protein
VAKAANVLSELGQDLKLFFDVANWDFQLCDKSVERYQPRRWQSLRWPIPLSKAISNPFDKEQPRRGLVRWAII